jgi:hypothetical protein
VPAIVLHWINRFTPRAQEVRASRNTPERAEGLQIDWHPAEFEFSMNTPGSDLPRTT